MRPDRDLPKGSRQLDTMEVSDLQTYPIREPRYRDALLSIVALALNIPKRS